MIESFSTEWFRLLNKKLNFFRAVRLTLAWSWAQIEIESVKSVQVSHRRNKYEHREFHRVEYVTKE